MYSIVKWLWLDLMIMVGFNNSKWMKQRFSVLKITMTYKAKIIMFIWFKNRIISVWSSDLVDPLGLVAITFTSIGKSTSSELEEISLYLYWSLNHYFSVGFLFSSELSALLVLASEENQVIISIFVGKLIIFRSNPFEDN